MKQFSVSLVILITYIYYNSAQSQSPTMHHASLIYTESNPVVYLFLLHCWNSTPLLSISCHHLYMSSSTIQTKILCLPVSEDGRGKVNSYNSNMCFSDLWRTFKSALVLGSLLIFKTLEGDYSHMFIMRRWWDGHEMEPGEKKGWTKTQKLELLLTCHL